MKLPSSYPSPSALCTAAADFWLAAYSAAILEHGSFHVAFSGGTTPKKLYEKLATPAYQSKIDWQKVHIYFGDERFVPLDHPDSNYNMASKALLSHINCPAENIHPVSVESGSAEKAAALYEATLRNHLPANNLPTNNLSISTENKPQFDLVLLGLGPDGHTASLFPGTDAVNEKVKLCRAVFVEKFDSWRVSITFPVINNAKKILLLSEGSSKADIIKSLTDDNTPELQYPVQHVSQTNGFSWYVDGAAVNFK